MKMVIVVIYRSLRSLFLHGVDSLAAGTLDKCIISATEARPKAERRRLTSETGETVRPSVAISNVTQC